MKPENVKLCIIENNTSSNFILKCAFNLAEFGKSLWVISEKPISELPEDVQRPYSKAILKDMTFLYIPDRCQLLTYLEDIPKWYCVPDAIFVSEFEKYSSLGSTGLDIKDDAFLLVNLLESASYCGTRNSIKTLVILSTSSRFSGIGKYEALNDLYVDVCYNMTETEEATILSSILTYFNSSSK